LPPYRRDHAEAVDGPVGPFRDVLPDAAPEHRRLPRIRAAPGDSAAGPILHQRGKEAGPPNITLIDQAKARPPRRIPSRMPPRLDNPLSRFRRCGARRRAALVAHVRATRPTPRTGYR
jgi:hypothetical protein